MALKIKHQVFVSSTFTDLKTERAEVIQAISELDCIPAGMEAFVATNDEQWATIREVIGDCDYYVLILGGRYGSTTADGMSYTEKEYQFAKALGVPILAFVCDDIGALPSKNVESDPNLRKQLERLRSEVMSERMVMVWKTADQLSGQVSRSLARAIKNSPRPGWIRNEGGVAADYVQRMGELLQENATLRSELDEAKQATALSDQNLRQGADVHMVLGFITGRLKKGGKSYREDRTWNSTWSEIFSHFGALLANEASEEELVGRLKAFMRMKDEEANKTANEQMYETVQYNVYRNVFETILTQFRALGYVEHGVKRRTVSDKSKYWRLTPLGDRTLVATMALRR